MTIASVHSAGFVDLDGETAYGIWKLRVDVFVVEQSCIYSELDGRDLDAGTRHLWVGGLDGPVGYLRILDDEGAARIGRVCVAAAHRGEGLARRLMDAALAEIGDRDSVLNAQAYLASWYERYGFVTVGPEFLDDGIPHVPMRRRRADT